MGPKSFLFWCIAHQYGDRYYNATVFSLNQFRDDLLNVLLHYGMCLTTSVYRIWVHSFLISWGCTPIWSPYINFCIVAQLKVKACPSFNQIGGLMEPNSFSAALKHVWHQLCSAAELQVQWKNLPLQNHCATVYLFLKNRWSNFYYICFIVLYCIELKFYFIFILLLGLYSFYFVFYL